MQHVVTSYLLGITHENSLHRTYLPRSTGSLQVQRYHNPHCIFRSAGAQAPHPRALPDSKEPASTVTSHRRPMDRRTLNSTNPTGSCSAQFLCAGKVMLSDGKSISPSHRRLHVSPRCSFLLTTQLVAGERPANCTERPDPRLSNGSHSLAGWRLDQ